MKLSQLWKKGRETRPYSEIDPKVTCLVDAMNATGLIATVGSCQGHPNKSPYVYFSAPTSVAASIEKLLRDAFEPGDPTSQNKNRWSLVGLFNGNYELTFNLHSPVYEEKVYSLFAPIFLGLHRKRIDAELRWLAEVVKEAARLHAPKQPTTNK